MLWAQFVDLLRAAILTVAQVCNGSLGVAVFIVAFALRLALLPLTLRLARRALRHQRRLLALQPEVERVRKRYASDPAAQWRETAKVYQRRGIKLLDPAALWGALVQLPLLAALYSALRRGIGAGVRFLGIPDLSLPNGVLAVLVTGVTVASMAITPSADPSRRIGMFPLLVMAGFTIWFLATTSSLFALSTGAGSLVNVLQAYLLRRGERREAVQASRRDARP